MKIAQIAPLAESVPPKLYGGTERIVSYLTEELVAQGHDVTLFASGDSVTNARLVGCSDARALLFPIDWPEPFGLVTIEAMACGTPVIAFRCGSVPEVIDNGASGILVDSMTEAVENVGWVLRMDRKKVRATFEKRFSADRMARDYIDIYRSLPGVRTKAASLRRANGQGLDLQVVA
jgi:glycosyltransferase involved in cell wall biosynthesis